MGKNDDDKMEKKKDEVSLTIYSLDKYVASTSWLSHSFKSWMAFKYYRMYEIHFVIWLKAEKRRKNRPTTR